MFSLCVTVFLLIYILITATKKLVAFSRIAHAINKLPSKKPLWPFGHTLPFLLAPAEDYLLIVNKTVRDCPGFPHICLIKFWTFYSPKVAIINASAAEVLLRSTRHITKAKQYELLHPWLGEGLLTSTCSKWQSHRKLLTPSFHFRILDNFMPVFNEHATTFANLLQSHEGNGPFDIFPPISRCTLDIICGTAMGVNINAQKNPDSAYFKAVTVLLQHLVYVEQRPWLTIPWIYYFCPIKRENDKCLNILHSFTEKVIYERKKEYHANKEKVTEKETSSDVSGMRKCVAFLDTLIEAMDKGDGHFTDEELREEVDTFMFEGHDTTATALIWILYHLGFNPSIQDKVLAELDAVFYGGDYLRDVTKNDIAELKYLEAVIKESLRLVPPIPLFGRALTEDLIIDGYRIPKGVDVWILTHFIHRDPEIYDNPDKFDPDRFLYESSKLSKSSFSYLPFSAGPRNCIGQKFAFMEIKVILAHFFRHYEVKGHDKIEDVKLSMIVSRPIHGLKLNIKKRF